MVFEGSSWQLDVCTHLGQFFIHRILVFFPRQIDARHFSPANSAVPNDHPFFFFNTTPGGLPVILLAQAGPGLLFGKLMDFFWGFVYGLIRFALCADLGSPPHL